jgi:curved DNA-binding protein CbpA
MAETSFYQILEVKPAASPEEVRAAYEKLSAQPDLAGTPEGKARLDAINEAFATLSDPVKRARYDMSAEARKKPVSEQVQMVQPMWTPRVFGTLLVLAALGTASYFYAQEVEEREAAEKAVAAKAAEAVAARKRQEEELARADAEAAAKHETALQENERLTAKAAQEQKLAEQKRKSDEIDRKNAESTRGLLKAQEKQMEGLKGMLHSSGVPVDIPKGKPPK